MRYAFIHAQRQQHRVGVLCAVMKVARSGYYAWRTRPLSRRAVINAALRAEIRGIHQESRGTYGVPRVQAELRARGQVCNHKRLARLMRLEGLQGLRKGHKRVSTTRATPTHPVVPNHLNRDFSAERPNQKWTADITYIPTHQGWLYLAVVLDLFARRVVGWAMATDLSQNLVHTALQMALVRRQPPPGLLHHSDRGSQYTAHAYQNLLSHHHILPSMSRTGDCYDNAPTESFFATLKSELATPSFGSLAHARSAIFDFIEIWYNRKRRHSSLGFRAPLDFEALHSPSFLSTISG